MRRPVQQKLYLQSITKAALFCSCSPESSLEMDSCTNSSKATLTKAGCDNMSTLVVGSK